MKPRSLSQLVESIRSAMADGTALEIVGTGSKRGYGRPVEAAAVLDMSGFSGIVEHQPEELTVTVLAGTPLDVLTAALAEKRQRLAFEPADWSRMLGGTPGTATIGGVVGCNIAGPRRVSQWAARDHVLGIKAVSGLGEAFVCGGKVVKNVTGFDIAKLLCGSLGTLAAMYEITLRVAPIPETQCTLTLDGLDHDQGIAAMTKALSSPYEVSGAAQMGAITGMRLEGPARSVAARAEALRHDLAIFGDVGVMEEGESAEFWADVRDVAPLADDNRILWRLMAPPAATARAVAQITTALPVTILLDRGGALAWLAAEGSDPAAERVRAAAEAAGGRATLFRAPAETRADIPPFHPEPDALAAVSRRVKDNFDPRRILNPGRMVP